MAEIREREIVRVSNGTTTKKKTAKKAPAEKKKAVEAKVTKRVITTAAEKKKALTLRIIAAVMWLLAIAAEVLTILIINKTIYLGDSILTFILIGLGVDLAFVIAGSLLWKRSNRIDPISEKNKLKFFLWNNMGLFAAIICFVPLIILLLKEKDLDPKVKKIATIVAIIVAVIASLFSFTWNPVSEEDKAEALDLVSEYTVDGMVYWTPFGKCYHLDQNCGHIKNSAKLFEGEVGDAFEANRSKPCSRCASEEALAGYAAEQEKITNTDTILDGLIDEITNSDVRINFPTSNEVNDAA